MPRLPAILTPKLKVEPDRSIRYTMTDLTAQEAEGIYRNRFKAPKNFGRWMLLIFAVCMVIFFGALRGEAAVQGGTFYWKAVAVVAGCGPFAYRYLKSLRPSNRYAEDQLSKTEVSK